jgi:hypothetical protein
LNEGLKVIKTKSPATAVFLFGVEGDSAMALANVPKDRAVALNAVEWVKKVYSHFGDASTVRGAPVVAQITIADVTPAKLDAAVAAAKSAAGL